ncbi:MAG: cyclic nucleotide-binding domain-containing protein [Candidatus Riflebacteria bacterium]|nr:cyclic nucleotide-binding domain-containing protein [Candidatus Riflebacteria bacterium]
MTVQSQLDLAKLRQYPIFEDLTEDELKVFLADTQLARYDLENWKVLAQGDPGAGLGIILAGKVKIYRVDPTNREHFLTVLKEGDFFGEMALFSTSTRSANVQALEPTVVLWLKAEDFKRFVSSHSPMISKILARMVADLSKRLRLLDERYVFMKSYHEARAA